MEKQNRKPTNRVYVELTEAFRRELVLIRKRSGLTQEKAAEKCVLAKGTIHLIENSKQRCKPETLFELDKAYDLPEGSLFEKAKKMIEEGQVKMAEEEKQANEGTTDKKQSISGPDLSRRKMMKWTAQVVGVGLAGLGGAGMTIWIKAPRADAVELKTLLQNGELFLRAGKYRQVRDNMNMALIKAGHNQLLQSKMFALRGMANRWLGEFKTAESDADHAKVLADQAVKEADQATIASIHAEADLIQAEIAAVQSQFNKAISFYNNAISLSEENKADAVAAMTYKRFGVCKRYIGELDSAIGFFESSLVHAEKTQDPYALGSCYSRMVTTAYEIDDMQKAQEYTTEANKILEGKGYATEQVVHHSNLAEVQLFNKQRDAALVSAERAVKYAGETSSLSSKISSFIVLANALRVQGHLTEARNTLIKKCAPLLSQYKSFGCAMRYELASVALYSASGQTELAQRADIKLQKLIDDAIKSKEGNNKAQTQNKDAKQKYADLLTKQKDRYLDLMRDNKR